MASDRPNNARYSESANELVQQLQSLGDRGGAEYGDASGVAPSGGKVAAIVGGLCGLLSFHPTKARGGHRPQA